MNDRATILGILCLSITSKTAWTKSNEPMIKGVLNIRFSWSYGTIEQNWSHLEIHPTSTNIDVDYESIPSNFKPTLT